MTAYHLILASGLIVWVAWGLSLRIAACVRYRRATR